MNYPKISIVTPSFNHAAFLEKTILSVLEQQYPNLDYIIMDGGSTDGSVEIIRKYEKHVACWRSEKDGGMYRALQKGFDLSSGEIMCWLNSDDMFHKKSLFTVAEIFETFSEVNWLIGAPSCFDESDRTVIIKEPIRWSRNLFLSGTYKWIQQESTFWRRTLWLKANGLNGIKAKVAGDFELWLRFFKQDKPYTTTALLSGFRLRSSGQLSMQHKELYEQEAQTLLSEFRNNLSPEEKKKLRQLQRMKLWIKIPLVRSWVFNYYQSLFELTPLITFNRGKQLFILPE